MGNFDIVYLEITCFTLQKTKFLTQFEISHVFIAMVLLRKFGSKFKNFYRFSVCAKGLIPKPHRLHRNSFDYDTTQGYTCILVGNNDKLISSEGKLHKLDTYHKCKI